MFMAKTIFKRILAVFLSMMMLFSVFMIATSVISNAAESTVSVVIKDVTRRYQEAAEFLDELNEFRTNKKLGKWVMDQNLLEKAMVRAAELSVYASLESPDGTNFLNSTVYDTGELIGCDVFSLSSQITNFTKESRSNTVLNADYMGTVGVGIVEISGKKYICVLTSNQKATQVDSTVLSQPDLTINQQIKIRPSLIKNYTCAYSNGQKVYCGTSLDVMVKLQNSLDSSLGAYLSCASFNVSSSDTSVFQVQSDKKVKAVGPGTSTITLTLSGMSSFKVQVTLEAVSIKFASCKVQDIADQIYTGSEIKPKPVITYSGKTLIENTDYTLSYSNNINYGKASVTITGIGKYAGEKLVKNFNIVANTTSFVVASAVSAYQVSVGQKVTITASSCNGKSTVNYTYSYTTSSSSKEVVIKSASTSASCDFYPSAKGTYYIKVLAKDSSGNTASVNKTVTVQPKISLSVSLSNTNMILGGTQTVKSLASGGVAPLQYACYVQLPDSTSWKTVKDFSGTSTFTYKPTAAGKYTICVKCKSASGSVAKEYKEFTVTKSTLVNKSYPDKKVIALGESVNLLGRAEKGAGSYQYAYFYKLSTAENYSVLKKYSTATSAKFTPKSAGTYHICIKVMDGAQTVVKQYDTITVNKAITLKTTLSSSSIDLKNSVTVTASASGGSGTGYTYAFYLKKSSDTSWVTKADFSKTASAKMTPSAATTYDICVKVKDSAGSIQRVYLTLKVNPQLVNNSSLGANTITKGSKATVKLAASGGSGAYSYAVYYKRTTDSAWKTAQEYSKTTSVSFQPAQATAYDVCIKVKDSLGVEVKKYLTLTVK